MIVGWAFSFITATICPLILSPILAAEVAAGGPVVVGPIETLTLRGRIRILGITDGSVTVEVDRSGYPSKHEGENSE